MRQRAKNLSTRVSQVRNSIENLEPEREDILYAPACCSDVAASMSAWVKRRRAEYAGRLH